VDYLIASEAFTAALAEREGPAVSGSRPGANGTEAETDDAKTNRGIAALRCLSDRWVGFTRGGLGCVWQTEPGAPIRALPALPGPAVDTTAAGDIFHGAFAYGLLTERDPERALLWATAAAGLSVRRPGGRASIPTLEETKAIIERGLVSIGTN
jgi:sulfofructose kinase